jgi:hypothetical protein
MAVQALEAAMVPIPLATLMRMPVRPVSAVAGTLTVVFIRVPEATTVSNNVNSDVSKVLLWL